MAVIPSLCLALCMLATPSKTNAYPNYEKVPVVCAIPVSLISPLEIPLFSFPYQMFTIPGNMQLAIPVYLVPCELTCPLCDEEEPDPMEIEDPADGWRESDSTNIDPGFSVDPEKDKTLQIDGSFNAASEIENDIQRIKKAEVLHAAPAKKEP